MALSVPEWVAYREVRETIVKELAGGELPTGSPRRLRLEQLERELRADIADAGVAEFDVVEYYERASGGHAARQRASAA